MFLVVPIVLSLLSGDFRLALILIFVAGFSDGLDGFLAKTFDWRTRLGGILDPLADKLLLVAVMLTLASMGLTPVWLAVVVVARDLIIVGGALAYNALIGPVKSNPSVISKLNTACQLIYMLLVIANQAIGWPQGTGILIMGAAVLFTSVVSGLDYVLRWSSKAAAVGRA
jgi:cardiolipin synthase